MPIAENVKLGKNVKIPYPELVNLYGCTIEDDCFVGPFVEIQNDVIIGGGSRIQSHSFICSKVRIGKNTFIGHGVMFINDRHPVHKNEQDWEGTFVGDKAVLGTNATILPCHIGENALIGAGAVVTKNVPDNAIVASQAARRIG